MDHNKIVFKKKEKGKLNKKIFCVSPNYVKLFVIPDECLINLIDKFINNLFNEENYIHATKNMKTNKKCIIINLLEAQKKFFEDKIIENPLFHYNINDDELDIIYNKCNGNKIHFNLFYEARRILEIVKVNYKTYDNYENIIFNIKKYNKKNDKNKKKTFLTRYQIKNYIMKYIQNSGIKHNVQIEFKENLISAIQIFKKNNSYYLQLQCHNMTRQKIRALCNHEIGTHLIRMINHHYNELKKFGINICNVTEEGLAVINSMYSLKKKKNHLYLISPALKYLAVCLGNFYSFSKLYRFLNTFVIDKNKCFKICARVKRGLTDTSLQGSVYHDQLYFIGSYSILKWFKNIDFPLLYSGNIGLSYLNTISKYVNTKNNLLPYFLVNQKRLDAYMKFLQKVSYINGITPERCTFIQNGKIPKN
ncbi:conserved Plasmodium protein, unknown function [Plasmodium gaboni]|uniref:DUF1704 domain-containing protein n=1 Tax=Plasmodium gaboni TaxID=647221 RepID=A0ABY1UNR6_9APIC|nr:conserved Plasmodium protein, unknown function [Plasmodium gaboni]